MLREDLFANARDTGEYMQEQLRTLLEIPIVRDVRGKGLMGCVECELIQGENDLATDLEVGKLIDSYCQANGLIVRPLVNMCVMSPPLTITREQIDDMVDILRAGILAAAEAIESGAGAPKDGYRQPSPAA
jgi:adenosylmethionine-8-amino-7-oxononanoate aminotransferase